MDLQRALNEIKEMIENAIITGGTAAKNNLIRTSQPIQLIHEVIKTDLINLGIDKNLIRPLKGETRGELPLCGFVKKKAQDICVVAKNIRPKRERLDFDGILKGYVDLYGKEFTEKTLSINVRSQLSSMAKNFDTLYERTFAEALNLHVRCNKMVLGEFYMIAVKELCSDAANQSRVLYKENRNLHNHIAKYISSFNAVNNRVDFEGDEYKYERVCLLIVDFSYDKPKYFDSTEELIEAGLLRDQKVKYDTLNYSKFVSDLTEVYQNRFGSGSIN
jgi:hypothetical protein